MTSNIATKAASIACLVYFEHNYFRKWSIKNSPVARIKKSGQKVWENIFFRTKKEEKRQSQKRIHAFFDYHLEVFQLPVMEKEITLKMAFSHHVVYFFNKQKLSNIIRYTMKTDSKIWREEKKNHHLHV